ncbi:hypothetical protein DUNSADRAFT_17482 [Dunaliella salina]|uniref:Uncharacterized protein n=1 Tax=Dunaliella salina TaxID=3046 RepID=A0ABQ7G1P2_DUNSA|nr:hypothetical protein DUNSADRAFT_17482 [Dunaliella salina]|eukprot:KAF5828524.1 hypothetical protein DUNSADRAFT_17482 [Dunaliella salina]
MGAKMSMSGREQHRPEKWAEAWLESRAFQRAVLCFAGASCALRVLQAGNLSALCLFLLDFALASALMFGVMQRWMSHKYQDELPDPDQQEEDEEGAEDEDKVEPIDEHAGSPADLILEVLDLIMEGGMPHSHDLHLLRDSILKGALHNAMYQPLNLGQDLHRLTMEPDVEASLYQQLLGSTMTPQGTSESAQEHVLPEVKQGPPSLLSASGKLMAASSFESELEEGPGGSEDFMAKILSSLACDTGGILKAKHQPPGRSKSSTLLSKLMVLQQGRRLSYKEEPKAAKRVSETIMGDTSLMVLEDDPSTGPSTAPCTSPATGAHLKSVPSSKATKDPPLSAAQSALDLLLSKVRPAGQTGSTSSRRSSWHVMNRSAAELDHDFLPNDDMASEDKRESPASELGGGEKEKGVVRGGKSKRRWSVGWQQQERQQEQREQPQQQLPHGHEALARPLTEEVSIGRMAHRL